MRASYCVYTSRDQPHLAVSGHTLSILPFSAPPERGAKSQRPSRNADVATQVANHPPKGQNRRVFEPGQTVRVNLSGLRVKDVTFQSAVTDAVGNIIRQTSQEPPMYLVRLLFSFRGVNEVEVPPERIKAAA